MRQTDKTPKFDITSSWEKVVRVLNEQNPTKLDPAAKGFVEYAWNKFDARHVVDILMSKEPSYHGHKDVLFAGFCAWVVATSERQDIVKSTMALRTLEIIRTEESNVPERLLAYPVLVDIYVRLIRIGSDFFQDIYYPIGGIGRLITSPSRSSMKRSLKKRRSGVRSVVTMMEITHYCIVELTNGDVYREPSYNAAFTIIDVLSKAEAVAQKDIVRKPKSEQYLRSRSLKIYRNFYEGQMCLLYAASSIQVKPNRSLLDQILAGDANWENEGHLLPEWIARSNFGYDVILSALGDRELSKADADLVQKLLADLGASPIQPPVIQEQMQLAIGSNRKR
ncbi:hypothetical protein [Microvirga antarctica]|uniref:hypothetical protein n=1 Tax=Microvirga antarctica TaxID=2819233 RepID=UPI001B30967A|nr:hypothetical protein [Microvirga antarctica]